MINQINIKNFKSIVDLTIPLGRFNVVIGPNGCGKSNILEAIAFASAAAENKLDNEYLLNRDVRVADPEFMINGFANEDNNDDETDIGIDNQDDARDFIQIKVDDEKNLFLCQLVFHDALKTWVNVPQIVSGKLGTVLLHPEELSLGLQKKIQDINEHLTEAGISIEDIIKLMEKVRTPIPELSNFLTYRPTEHYLRKTFETPIFPIGIHGEGLLKYLKECAEEKNVDFFNELDMGLRLLDWFDGIHIPDNLMKNEYRLSIGDKFLSESLHYFDQRSTNEGFLFILFYLTLFNSVNTPTFFAIDNIESALNPKLVTKLTEYLIERSFHNNKQVIVTTHSPYVLDGLDLSNPNVRLFVARRDIDGHTRIERIPYREDRPMKLSQLWMSGLIGGLPDNF